LTGDILSQEIFMTRSIVATFLAFTLMFGGSAAIPAAAAASSQAVEQKPHASTTDPSVGHRIHRYAYRQYDRPIYYGRPEYYRPYPYLLPAPFPFGLSFGPWW
jgi:hypothetical protein